MAYRPGMSDPVVTRGRGRPRKGTGRADRVEAKLDPVRAKWLAAHLESWQITAAEWVRRTIDEQMTRPASRRRKRA